MLGRPRLIERLKANLGNPVTMIAADAGCGKTTLIADFVRNEVRPAIWYQLDHTDADPAVFLGYVAHGIRDLIPGFGDAIFPYLAEAGEDVVHFPERAADLLINEILRSVEEPFILVLDDYHHIGRETVVHKLIDRLIQYSSDLLHLIITTRDLPPLAITRRRTQSSALVISRDDLLFTDDEVRSLFRQTLDLVLNDSEVADYRERTHGWITALQLVRQMAEQKIHSSSGTTRLDLTDILKQSERDIFDYFAEEVFSREPHDTRQLLLRLSLLESLELESCGRLFPDMRCSAALPELEQKNVFLTAAGDRGLTEEYRFHPLFRNFLRRRLRSEIGQAAVAEERNRIAEYFLENRKWETALPYLLDAQNFERAASVIADTGDAWIAAGAFTSLDRFAERVPAEVLEKYPRALLHRAEIARLHGEIDKSTNFLNRAVNLMKGSGESSGEAEALHSLASLARVRGRYPDAYKLLEEAEHLVTPDSETYIKLANTRGLCLIVGGNWTEAEYQFRIALDAAEKQSNERYIRLVTHNLALAPGFRGDFGEALRWFRRIFRNDQPDKQLPQEAIGHLNVARLHLYRGEFEETEKHLERSLELCQLYNMKPLRAEIFEAYGNFYREKVDFAHAAEYYERAATAYEEAGIDVSTKEFEEERAVFYILRGELARARSSLDKLVAIRRDGGREIGINTVTLRLFQVDLAEGKTDGLPEKIEELVRIFHRENHYYYEALATVLLAETLFSLGRTNEVIEPVQRALDLSARFDYDYWLRCEIRRSPRIFSIEEIVERLPPDLRSEIAAGRVVSAPTGLATAPPTSSPVTDLTINVLGHVETFRDPAKPFAADAWTTRRSRDIFCYIATSPHRRVSKDILIDSFWPDEDIETVEKNFHPTISHIRKALNSQQAFKQNFIIFRDGAYQLNSEMSYSVDTEEFERLIADAENAKREKDTHRLRESLEAAFALYRGDFMAGVYDDWAEERRQFYAEQFGRVLTALAKLALNDKRWAGALKYANQVLKLDPFREDIHRLILKVYSSQSKPGSIKKHFEDLQILLKHDLGVEPAVETFKLFHELMK